MGRAAGGVGVAFVKMVVRFNFLRNLFIVLIASFFLSGCANIAVDDFGSYWEKSGTDHQLIGWWKDPDDKEEYKIRVINRASTLHADIIDRSGLEDPKGSMRIRNLKLGAYHIMMVKTQDKGDRWKPFSIVRYKLDGKRLYTYSLNAKSMKKFVAKNYPAEKGIIASCEGKCANKDSTHIPHLNANIYKILSSIPDTRKYWKLDKQSLLKIR
ncbi:MAG: hypothetical protein JNM12_08390 [Alphaproteobacteria bacterium]|nr:hypothetical protein [Alphaproteobacteria bacterium]